MSAPLTYRVGTLRAAGLSARWGRASNGAPFLFAREGDRGPWYIVDGAMWKDMEARGVRAGFVMWTTLGEFFSIPA